MGTNYPLTWTEAAKLAPTKLMRSIINTFIDEYPLLAALPMRLWPGGQTFSYNQTQTLPTIAGVDETDEINSTTSVRRTLECRLAQRAGQIETPIFINSTLDSENNQEVEAILDLARAFGKDVASMVITGAFASVAISGDATTKGVDACSPGPRTDGLKGYGKLKFNDTGDYFSYCAPGDTAYGTAVAVAADGTYVLRSYNESKWVKVTIDISDSANGGNWEYVDALTFTDAKSADGLVTLVDPDYRWYGTGSKTTPSTNGDAFALELLDLALDSLAGPAEEQAFIMRKGMRRAFKTLMRGSQIQMVDEWMGMKLRRPALSWEGRPIFADDRLTKTETVGGTTTCSSIFAVHLNAENGFGMFYGAQRGRGAMWSQQQVGADISIMGNQIVFPCYLRGLPERDDKATEPVRLTSAMALTAMRPQCIVEIHGLSNAT